MSTVTNKIVSRLEEWPGLLTYNKPAYAFLKEHGYIVYGEYDTPPNLTKNGQPFYIGSKAVPGGGIEVGVVAFMPHAEDIELFDNSQFIFSKDDLMEMSASAKEMRAKKITLYTNFGMELHSQYDKPEAVGFDNIVKVIRPMDSFKSGGTMAPGDKVIKITPYQYNGWHYKKQLVWVDSSNKSPDPMGKMIWGYGEIDDPVSDFKGFFEKAGKTVEMHYTPARYESHSQEVSRKIEMIRGYVYAKDQNKMEAGGTVKNEKNKVKISDLVVGENYINPNTGDVVKIAKIDKSGQYSKDPIAIDTDNKLHATDFLFKMATGGTVKKVRIPKEERVTIMIAIGLLGNYSRTFNEYQVGYTEQQQIINNLAQNPKSIHDLNMAILYLTLYKETKNDKPKEKSLIERIIGELTAMVEKYKKEAGYKQGGNIPADSLQVGDEIGYQNPRNGRYKFVAITKVLPEENSYELTEQILVARNHYVPNVYKETFERVKTFTNEIDKEGFGKPLMVIRRKNKFEQGGSVDQYDKQKVKEIAAKFSEILWQPDWVGPEDMPKVIAENKSRNDDTCATHDYVDANMAMDEAFTAAMGREYTFFNDEEPETEKQNEIDTWYFNEAWDLAKENDFDVERINAADPATFARGGKVNAGISRDRKFRSQEPHEQAYDRKTSPVNPHYKERGGNINKGQNLDIYGYQTHNFDMCEGMAPAFKKAMEQIDLDMDNESAYYKSQQANLKALALEVDEILHLEKIAKYDDYVLTEADFSKVLANMSQASVYNHKCGNHINISKLIGPHIATLTKAQNGPEKEPAEVEWFPENDMFEKGGNIPDIKTGDTVTINSVRFIHDSQHWADTPAIRKFYVSVHQHMNDIGKVMSVTFGTANVKFSRGSEIKIPKSILQKLELDKKDDGGTFKKGGTIDTDTPIIPEIIADSVANDVVRSMHPNPTAEQMKAAPDKMAALSEHLVKKTNDLYKSSPFFKKKMNQAGNKGRDALYTFMYHWSEAYTNKNFAAGGKLAPNFKYKKGDVVYIFQHHSNPKNSNIKLSKEELKEYNNVPEKYIVGDDKNNNRQKWSKVEILQPWHEEYGWESYKVKQLDGYRTKPEFIGFQAEMATSNDKPVAIGYLRKGGVIQYSDIAQAEIDSDNLRVEYENLQEQCRIQVNHAFSEWQKGSNAMQKEFNTELDQLINKHFNNVSVSANNMSGSSVYWNYKRDGGYPGISEVIILSPNYYGGKRSPGARPDKKPSIILFGGKGPDMRKDILLDEADTPNDVIKKILKFKDHIVKFTGKGILKNNFESGGTLSEEEMYMLNKKGFTIEEFGKFLDNKFPDSFRFQVYELQEGTRDAQLSPDFDKEVKDNKLKLFFPKRKQSRELVYKVFQGGENTYFYFILETETDQYIGNFGFKDEGSVPAEYITRFTAFLMEAYGYPFQSKNIVYADGGEISVPHKAITEKEFENMSGFDGELPDRSKFVSAVLYHPNVHHIDLTQYFEGGATVVKTSKGGFWVYEEGNEHFFTKEGKAIEKAISIAKKSYIQTGGTLNNWQVYYMDNDGRKQIIDKKLTYSAAVKLSQKNNSDGLSAEYESMESGGNIAIPGMAETLVEQLGKQTLYMLGAYNLVKDTKNNWLSFRIKGSTKVNYIKITLERDDTYTMEFGRIRKVDYRKAISMTPEQYMAAGYKVVNTVKGVYFEDLHKTIETNTGLYTKLFESGGELSENQFSSIQDGEVFVDTKKLKNLFSFLGDGVSNIFENHPGPGDFTLEFDEDSAGDIGTSQWEIAIKILEEQKGKNGFEDFAVKSSHNRISLHFNSDDYTIGYESGGKVSGPDFLHIWTFRYKDGSTIIRTLHDKYMSPSDVLKKVSYSNSDLAGQQYSGWSSTTDKYKEFFKLKKKGLSDKDAVTKIKENDEQYEAGGQINFGTNGLLHALLEFVSSGTIANKTGLRKYKDIDGVRSAAIQMLLRDGDREYSMSNLEKLLGEAKDEWAENKAEHELSISEYKDGGKLNNHADIDKKVIDYLKAHNFNYIVNHDSNNMSITGIKVDDSSFDYANARFIEKLGPGIMTSSASNSNKWYIFISPVLVSKHETGGKLSADAKRVIRPEWEKMQLFFEMTDNKVPQPIQNLVNDMIDRKVIKKTVTIGNDVKFLNDAKPAIDKGYITVNKSTQGEKKYDIRLGKAASGYVKYADGGTITKVDTNEFPLGEQQRLIQIFLDDQSKKQQVLKELSEYHTSYLTTSLDDPKALLFGKPYKWYVDQYGNAIKYVRDFNGDIYTTLVESEKYPGQFTFGHDEDGFKPMYTKEEIELMKSGHVIELELRAARTTKEEMLEYKKEIKAPTVLIFSENEFGGNWRLWKKNKEETAKTTDKSDKVLKARAAIIKPKKKKTAAKK